MASGIVGRPHNFNVFTREQECIQPVLLRSVNVKPPTNAARISIVIGSDKLSKVTVTSPVSETSLSTSSSSWDFTNDNSTDRASSCILREDRFDRQASRKVQLLFDNIESTLFKESSGDQRLENECNDWQTAFPHLRVVGSTLVAGLEDPGFKHFEALELGQSDDARSSEETGNHKTNSSHHALQKLVVAGHPIRILRPPTFVRDALSDQPPKPDHEEIFAIEGDQEEVLAVDWSPKDYSNKKLMATRKRRGHVSPPSCWRNDICNTVFDDAWTTIISSLRPVIAKYLRRADVIDGVRDSSPSGAAKPSIRLTSPRVPASSSLKAVVTSDKSTRTSSSKLTGLLTICSKTLLERDKQLDAVPIPVQRLRQSNTVTQQQVSAMSALDSQQPLVHSPPRQFDRLGSARTPISRGRQLMSSSSDPSTNFVDERVTDITMVRGHRLSISVDHSTTPTMLPPLQSSISNRQVPLLRHNWSRAISAVTTKSALRDKMLVLTPSRPKTMQTFSLQSDVDRRSSTSFSFHSPRQTAVTMTTSAELAFSRRSKSQLQGSATDRQNTMHQEIRGIKLRRHNTISG